MAMRNKILQITRSTIPYVKELREHTGSVTSTILMQQLDFWFAKYPNGFYKFLSNCDHPACDEQRTWVVELGFSEDEFRTAFDNIGKRWTSKTKFEEAEDKFQEKFYCSYFNRREGKTYYFRNHKLVDSILDELTTVNGQSQFTETENPNPVYKEEDTTQENNNPPNPPVSNSEDKKPSKRKQHYRKKSTHLGMNGKYPLAGNFIETTYQPLYRKYYGNDPPETELPDWLMKQIEQGLRYLSDNLNGNYQKSVNNFARAFLERCVNDETGYPPYNDPSLKRLFADKFTQIFEDLKKATTEPTIEEKVKATIREARQASE